MWCHIGIECRGGIHKYIYDGIVRCKMVLVILVFSFKRGDNYLNDAWVKIEKFNCCYCKLVVLNRGLGILTVKDLDIYCGRCIPGKGKQKK